MAISIADLKKKQGFLDKIKEKMDSNKSKGGSKDERFWSPTFDKETGGSAVIRFLPSKDLNEIPFVEVISHYFERNGQKYNEKSLVTLKQADPVAELNKALWDTGIQSNKDQASKQKRRKKYIANILVVKDAANPSNVGKVFLYEFGPAVWNKMQGAMFPPSEADDRIDIFDVFNGADFYIKLRPQMVGDNILPSYNDCHFGEPKEIKGDIEEIINSTYSLKEFVDPANFKSYHELATRLVEVLGYTTGTGIPTNKTIGQINQADVKSVSESRQKAPAKPASYDDDDEDDDLAAMKRLLEEDGN